MKNRNEKKPGKRPPKKLKTLDLGALIAFNKMKAWVKKNEPENYSAFQPKAAPTAASGRRSRCSKKKCK